MLDLLGQAGCVSIEAGIESFTEEGRAELSKQCRADTPSLVEKLVHARRSVPFVQGNLIATAGDDPALVAHWRGVQIGRASCRERVCHTCRSRWSPYH